MKNRKYLQGYKITKYDNETTCYVYYYDSISLTRANNSEMGFSYAKKKFQINEENYSSLREDGKTIYTRKQKTNNQVAWY